MAATGSVLAALVLGLGAGFAIHASGNADAVAVAAAVKPIGTVWLSALRMTIVPLIFTMVATGIGSLASTGMEKRVIGLAVATFVTLLVFAAVQGLAIESMFLWIWPTPPGALDGLAVAAVPHPDIPPIVDQLVGMIPVNPVAAAANGEMTPLVIFAVVFGLAIMRVAPARRDGVVTMLKGVGDAMMVIVMWVLRAAPLGVFVLALGVAQQAGMAIAGVLAQGLVTTTAAVGTGVAMCYVIALIGGNVSIGRFAAAAAGPQAVAGGTCSSMATLPAMIEAAETKLRTSPALAGAILPLAVSTFRFGNVTLVTSTALFAAHAAGIQPGIGTLVMTGCVVILTNIGVVGLPAAAVLFAADAPAFQTIGAPLELLPLLVATAAIPDAVDTICNVTGDLAALTVISRWMRKGGGGRGAGGTPIAEITHAPASVRA